MTTKMKIVIFKLLENGKTTNERRRNENRLSKLETKPQKQTAI